MFGGSAASTEERPVMSDLIEFHIVEPQSPRFEEEGRLVEVYAKPADATSASSSTHVQRCLTVRRQGERA
eukprot:15477747-Alexandrium_andersonii.AAC.1